ncbi:LmeA family phospholipid-binding protein [Corynebacterium sp. A21]|uniref:LmeA family phospholipid-binding protein n=1 Tax=Corynebacterium sp. A21 TaxID=3457318 RepID=UPI003FD3D9C5
MRVPRKVAVPVAVLVILAGLLWLADSLIAARVEHRISERVAEHANLETNPGIFIGGVPYLQALITGDLPLISADALDVDVPGLGMVNARSEATDLQITPEQVFSGDVVGAPAEMITRTVSLDGVALGHLLGMTDLDIANPYDISPSGGRRSEAQLTGTPAGFDEAVSVLVSLRLDGQMFHMSPRQLIDVPAGREEDAQAAFSWDLDTHQLPLADQAQAVYVQGGSIYFRAQKQNVPLELKDLSPIESSPSEPESGLGTL